MKLYGAHIPHVRTGNPSCLEIGRVESLRTGAIFPQGVVAQSVFTFRSH